MGAALGFLLIILNVGIIGLVVVSTSQRGWSGLLGNDAVDTSSGPRPTASPSPTPIPEPSPTDADDETVTVGPSSSTSTEEPEPEDPSLADRYADNEDLTVVVLGDQTGADPADWVMAWARQLANSHVVEVQSTTTADPTVYAEPEVFGIGDSTVTIYNASRIGNTPGYAANRLGALLPEDPDVILINFGRSNDTKDLSGDLDQLWSGIQDRDLYARVVVQPPRQDGLPTLDEQTRAWAEDNDVDTLDVAAVFADEGIIQTTVSTRDPLSVNLFGADRWAQIVQTELFDTD